MKKRNWWVLAALGVALLGIIVWILLPKAPKEQPTSIMVNGIVYDCTDQETEAPRDDQILGAVASAVERTELPEQEGQSNFQECVGQPYAEVEGQIVVYYENAWHLCVRVYG